MDNDNHIIKRIEEWLAAIALGVLFTVFLNAIHKKWIVMSSARKNKVKSELIGGLKLTLILTVVFFIILACTGKYESYFKFLDDMK